MLILRAAAPWSPSTHTLWGAPQREYAVEVLKIGHLLASKYAGPGNRAFVDVWLTYVLPHAVTRGALVRPPATHEEHNAPLE